MDERAQATKPMQTNKPQSSRLVHGLFGGLIGMTTIGTVNFFRSEAPVGSGGWYVNAVAIVIGAVGLIVLTRWQKDRRATT